MKELDALFDRRMAETEQADAAAAQHGTPPTSPLPAELRTAQARREKLRELLAQAQAADESRRKDGINVAKNPAQIPKADVDSRVMPNKEGGYAPNYTPLAATDAASRAARAAARSVALACGSGWSVIVQMCEM